MNGYVEDTAMSFRDRFNADVAAFDAQVAALAQAESDLWDVQPIVQASNDANLMAQWQGAMDRVIAISATVDSVRSQVQSVSAWWVSVRDSLGLAAGGSGTLSRFAGMGLFPAIPWGVIALIVGGTTAIAGVLYAASTVINRARQYQLQQANIDAAANGTPQVVDVAPPGSDGPGIFDSITKALAGLGDAVPWIVGGAIVLMLSNNAGGNKGRR